MKATGLYDSIARLTIHPRITRLLGSGICDSRFSISSYFGAISFIVLYNNFSFEVESSIVFDIVSVCGFIRLA